jgi:hypothetical protein
MGELPGEISQWRTRWEILANGRAARGDQSMREVACEISRLESRLVRIANNILALGHGALPGMISYLEIRLIAS